MKVLQVAMRLDPALGGSTASTITNIVAEQRHGIENTVVFAAGADDELRTRGVVDLLSREGAHVERLPRASRPAAAAAQFGLSRSAASWLAGNLLSFDVVHVHGPWGGTSAWALLLARRHGVPTVLTARESLTVHDRDSSQSPLRARAKTAAWSLVPRLADVVVYTSKLEDDGSPTTGRLGSRLIWHAVVDDAQPSPERRPRAAVDDTVVVGFLGRFAWKKKADLLLEAVALDGRLRLLVAGGGDAAIEGALHSQAQRLGIEDRVEFLGFIPSSERPLFFDRIDVLAMPSVYENFGMSAAEAMEHGVPVLVGERTGIAEVLHIAGGGSTVELDPPAIVKGLLSLVRRARDPDFAAEVQRVARERLSYTAHAREAAALYDELVNRQLG
jgi:glycosyltransferase involved in cell wall biosynthesis